MATLRLQNSYSLRTSQQDRPCFICNRFSNAVLTTDGLSPDWFYICRPHLDDRGFCSVIGGVPPPPSLSLDAPRKNDKKKSYSPDVKPESNSVTDLVTGIGSGIWNTLTGAKKEEEKKDNKKDDKDDKKDDEEGKKSKPPPLSPTIAPTRTVSSPPAQPRKYILHRDIFYLREKEFITKQEKKRASEILQKYSFPAVPKTIPQ